MDEFWAVPNSQGLPTRTAEQIVAGGGINPNAGKGALITLSPGSTVADGGPFLKLDWVGAGVLYDDLGFFDDSVGFIIPDVNPPIQRVRMWTQLVWPDATGTRGMFHSFVGSNVPITGLGFDQLPETGIAAQFYRNTLASAPITFNNSPIDTDKPLNCFVGQTSGAPLTLSVQQMAIEVVR